MVTLTVTEAGYMRAPGGALDTSRADVQADIAALEADPMAPRAAPTPGADRRRATWPAGPPVPEPIAIVPCDNLPDNGPALKRVVDELIAAVDPTLADWAAENVAFGTTMVDRITPATTDEHRDAVLAALGVVDASPVPTEPFSEWVIAGEFPKGGPPGTAAGARVVDDVAPVRAAQAVAAQRVALAARLRRDDPAATRRSPTRSPTRSPAAGSSSGGTRPHGTSPCRRRMLPPTGRALLDRFENPNIRHALAQIAADGSQKLPVRIVPTLRAERAAGRVPQGATRVIAAWTCHLRGLGAPVKDVRADEVAPFGEGTLEESVAGVLGFLGEDLAADATAPRGGARRGGGARRPRLSNSRQLVAVDRRHLR